VTWPGNTFITYETKLTDTHNSMNTETGMFTAPFSGAYGFVFYSDFICEGLYSELFVEHNGGRTTIFFCQDFFSTISKSSSIYFALSLKQADTVAIFSGTAFAGSFPHQAKFTGFLLQKE
jgi:hypothetical protein